MFLALIRLVRADDFLDLVHDEAFADRAALMRADIAECMQRARGADRTDLIGAISDQFARPIA